MEQLPVAIDVKHFACYARDQLMQGFYLLCPGLKQHDHKQQNHEGNKSHDASILIADPGLEGIHFVV